VSVYLSFLVLGLAAGAVYAALATGILAVYKASRVVNFAQGAMAMWGGYVYVTVRNNGDVVLPAGSFSLGAPATTVTAIIIGAVSGLLISLLAYFLVFRPLRHAPALAQVVASFGVLLTMQALVILRFGAESVNAPPILTAGNVSLFGTEVSGTALALAGIAVLFAVLLGCYMQYTKYGVATRAASENERFTILTGFSTSRLSIIAWSISGLLSTMAVILASATTGLNSENYTLYVIPALGAVLVARFTSIAAATAAALLIGMFQGAVTLASTQSWWPDWASPAGVSSALPFIVIVVALFVVGDKLPRRGAIVEKSLPRVDLPRVRPIPLTAAVAVFVVLLLVANGTYRFGLTTTLILAMICLSYVVLTGYLGQVSLAQAAFAGTAGFMLSKLTTQWGVPFPFDLLLASLAATLVGLLVAIPAIRIRGTQLAIVTLAAAAVIQSFIFNNPQLLGKGGTASPIVEPRLLGLDLSVREGNVIARLPFSLLVLVLFVVVALGLVRILSGATGKAFLAVRSNERAAAAAGLNVAVIKAVGFGMSAFIAGLGGCLLGYSRGQLSVASFTVFVGIAFLAFAYLGGITTLTGAVLAGVFGPLGVVYTFLDTELDFGQYYTLISGLGLLSAAVFNPSGMVGAVQETRDRILSKRRRAGTNVPPSEAAAPSAGGDRKALHA
jgi:branched-chain amino acid transport system permease protein